MYFFLLGALNVALRMGVTNYELLECCFTAVLLDLLVQGKLPTVRLFKSCFCIVSCISRLTISDPYFSQCAIVLIFYDYLLSTQ